jgi:predicted RNase H-like HicB family nuclease
MEFEGKVWKDGKYWLVEIPILDVMTQGKSKKDALRMIEDAITGLIECYFEQKVTKGLVVKAIAYEGDIIGITANDTKLLMALSLIKQREKSQSTVREVSQRMGSKSPNAYAQYEKGIVSVSLEKYEKLLIAANPTESRHVKVCIA